MTLKQKFLFSGIKEEFKITLLKQKKYIEKVVEEEMGFKFSHMTDYIGYCEEDKQRWFEELGEQFNLPSDYEFE